MKPSVPIALLAFLAPPPHNASAAEAPSDVRLAASWNSNTTIEIEWQDNSDDEDAFEFQVLEDPKGKPAFTATALKNQTLAGLTGGNIATDIWFRVRALSTASGDSDWSDLAVLTTPASFDMWMGHGTFHGGTVGQPIDPYMTLAFGNAATGFSATDLPPGLSIDATSGEITGTPTEEGLFRPIVSATDGTTTVNTFVTFRFDLPPTSPVLESEIPDQVIASESPGHEINLDSFFTDPDTTSAARISTNRGDINVILYPKVTPASVENFLNYVNRGDYTDLIFHRKVTLDTAGVDVVQGGWFKPDGNGGYETIATDPGVINEPGVSNTRGTISNAKNANPNSGTSNIFFNVEANTTLDAPSESGGFAVFGRAGDLSLPVIDDIFSLPVGAYPILLDGAPATIRNWPTNQVPAGNVPAPADLVQIHSAVELSSFFSYEITSNSNPGLVATSIDGNLLTISRENSTSDGEAMIEVTATDFDGNPVTDTFAVTVTVPSITFGQWASGQTFPDGLSGPQDDGEPDSLSNILEYGFLADPSAADAASVLPQLASATLADADHHAITFTHRKAPDLIYSVQKSTNLEDWVTIWRTTRGTGHSSVVAMSDETTHYALTVADPVPVADQPASNLRLQVELIAP